MNVKYDEAWGVKVSAAPSGSASKCAAVVIEQSTLVRRGISALLGASHIRCVATSSSATDGFRLVADTDADLVIVGTMADATHANFLGRLHAKRAVSSVVITPIGDLLQVYALYRAGAHAVLSPNASEPDFAEMLGLVMRGQRYVPTNLLVDALDKPGAAMSDRPPQFELTARERDVLSELALGRTNREIADHLCIGVETVKSHLNSIYTKFSVSRRGQAVSLAIRHRLL